ncbi:MAG TPA: hypothetical protein GX693_07675, partial [Firmicutes bacterium]|nr:hypothetical protein [Bacillota bacterium]
LAGYYLQKYSQIYGQGLKQLSSELASLFEAYPWPGNIRELAYAIEVAVNLAEGEQDLKPEHLPPYLRSKLTPGQPPAKQKVAAGKSAGSISASHYLIAGEHRPPKKYGRSIDLQSAGSNLNSLLREFEKQVILEELARNKGNITRTARELGLARQNLQYRIKKLKITGFKPG